MRSYRGSEQDGSDAAASRYAEDAVASLGGAPFDLLAVLDADAVRRGFEAVEQYGREVFALRFGKGERLREKAFRVGHALNVPREDATRVAGIVRVKRIRPVARPAHNSVYAERGEH